jgi:hypothetical protein
MNIFFLDRSPKLAAQYHCDKHVVKMIIETAQMLYSAHWMLNPSNLPGNAYKLAHKNHPCSIWVRSSLVNYLWLCSLGLYLCEEYKYRYGAHKTHKTEQHIRWLMDNPPTNIPFCKMTPPAQAMPVEFKNEDTITAYKTFYVESKLKQRGIVKYTRRDPPDFILANINGGDLQIHNKRSSET